MTLTEKILLVLVTVLAFGCAAFLFIGPSDRVNPEHPFETDPLTDDGEHAGRHRHPDDIEGDTVRLADYPLRWPRG